MSRIFIAVALLGAALSLHSSSCYGASVEDEHQGPRDSTAQAANPVVLWNRTLLVIVRTPKAQPLTIHPTRSFCDHACGDL